jgi:hypothetical protein
MKYLTVLMVTSQENSSNLSLKDVVDIAQPLMKHTIGGLDMLQEAVFPAELNAPELPPGYPYGCNTNYFGCNTRPINLPLPPPSIDLSPSPKPDTFLDVPNPNDLPKRPTPPVGDWSV